jgi:hypothetical protein
VDWIALTSVLVVVALAVAALLGRRADQRLQAASLGE